MDATPLYRQNGVNGMITVKASPRNNIVLLKIDRGVEFTRRAIRQGFFQLGKDLKKTASDEILRKPKGGHVYVIRGAGGSRRRHVASAPGETHANLSGRLRRSLGWAVAGAEQLEFGYMDGLIPNYAPFVEFGTSRMAARPSLQNAIGVTTRNAEVYFGAALAKEFA